MQRSTLLRDLARYLEYQADAFRNAGLTEWARHLQDDAKLMAGRADVLMQDEPPLPSIESMIGILPNDSECENRGEGEGRHENHVRCPHCDEIERIRSDLAVIEQNPAEQLLIEYRLESGRLRSALAGFVRCAEQRVWPMDSRVTEAKDLLGGPKNG